VEEKMGDYKCVNFILERDDHRYSLYLNADDSFSRKDLLTAVRKIELLNFCKKIGAKVIGVNIEKRIELSDDGTNRILEVLEKESFSSDLIPIARSLVQPAGHIADLFVAARGSKIVHFPFEKDDRSFIKVARAKSADWTCVFIGPGVYS
jgi:hypothetical protein